MQYSHKSLSILSNLPHCTIRLCVHAVRLAVVHPLTLVPVYRANTTKSGAVWTIILTDDDHEVVVLYMWCCTAHIAGHAKRCCKVLRCPPLWRSFHLGQVPGQSKPWCALWLRDICAWSSPCVACIYSQRTQPIKLPWCESSMLWSWHYQVMITHQALRFWLIAR